MKSMTPSDSISDAEACDWVARLLDPDWDPAGPIPNRAHGTRGTLIGSRCLPVTSGHFWKQLRLHTQCGKQNAQAIAGARR
jgi:hypothetical protein